jgi:hypothetical protein
MKKITVRFVETSSSGDISKIEESFNSALLQIHSGVQKDNSRVAGNVVNKVSKPWKSLIKHILKTIKTNGIELDPEEMDLEGFEEIEDGSHDVYSDFELNPVNSPITCIYFGFELDGNFKGSYSIDFSVLTKKEKKNNFNFECDAVKPDKKLLSKALTKFESELKRLSVKGGTK